MIYIIKIQLISLNFKLTLPKLNLLHNIMRNSGFFLNIVLEYSQEIQSFFNFLTINWLLFFNYLFFHWLTIHF